MKHYIYFIGAGGIGMAALERYFLVQGCEVAGYDRTQSELTDQLGDEGANIYFVDDPEVAVPEPWRNPADTLVVYTPAVPADSKIMQYFRNGGFEMMKRAQVLGIVTQRSKSLCFAGTHGKTTTSSMAAHILHSCPIGCNAFLGGVLRNYGSNFLVSRTSPWAVIEADEFDRSFHHLRPTIAVITATDPDHLDIYGTEEAYLESFAHFTELVQPQGAIVVHTGLKLKPRPAEGVRLYTYSATEGGDFHAENIRRGEGEMHFDFVHPTGRINDINLGVPVEINIDNAVAALAGCYLTGDMNAECARTAMSSFMGAKRRFEFHLKEPGRAIIDDYAHHPDELRASIASVKALYPNRKVTVVFQPHLYTRTRDFADGFAQALDLADEVVLIPIYPARELPIEGVSSEMILERMKCPNKKIVAYHDLVDTIKNSNFEVLLTVGAGDIADLVEPLTRAVTQKS